MADWYRKFTGGSYAGNWNSRLNYIITGQEAGNNRTYIEVRQYIYSDNGSYSQNGSWDGRIYVNGGEVNRNTPNANISNGQYLMNAWGGWIGHDANGNASISVGSYCNAPVNDMNQQNTGWGLPRLALAPTISSVIVDTVKPTTARIGAELSSYGHGTSVTFEAFYRLQGSGTWISLGQQGDVGGYNFWYPSGLKPGKTYETSINVWNNNGDFASSGGPNFKTQPVPGMVPVLMGLL